MAGKGCRTGRVTRVRDMDKPYDTTGREYFDEILGLWMDYLGLDPNGPVSIVDSAIATVAVEVDKVYRVDGPDPYIIHQADRSASCPGGAASEGW